MHLGTNCLALDHGAICLPSAHILALVATDTRSTAKENIENIIAASAKQKCTKETCRLAFQQDRKTVHGNIGTRRYRPGNDHQSKPDSSVRSDGDLYPLTQ